MVAGSSDTSWQPVVTANTTTSHYWLNWRVLLCAIFVLAPVIAALILIWKCEGFNSRQHDRGNEQEAAGFICKEDSWRPCLKEIHPAWLLAFRIIAFSTLLPLVIANAIVNGGGMFYYFTQWTFTLVTIYFGLGISLSGCGCYQFLNRDAGERVVRTRPDVERGMFMRSVCEGNASTSHAMKGSVQQEVSICQNAGIWGYAFQVIYQTCAGAVMLTDAVFWIIIFPFLEFNNYKLNFLLVVMHSMNAFFLLGDTALNCMRFPWFRIAYFVLWTAIYVIFQWIVHACVSLWWPYPFLDLSSPFAPIWYLGVGLLHIPCYAVFVLVIKTKHYLLSRWFPHSYQCLR